MQFDNIEHEIIYNRMIETLKRNRKVKEDNINDSQITHYEFIPNEVYDNINILNNKREIAAHRPLYSHRKIIGKFVIFSKKVARRCLKWYINPITEQQTEFNNAITPIIGKLTEITGNNVNNINDINADINDINTDINLLKQMNMKLEELEKTNKDLNVFIENRVLKIEEENKLILEHFKEYQKVFDKNNEEMENIKYALDIKLIEEPFFNKKTWSQSGEDTILAYIFYVLGIKTEDIEYLDLGANHAKELSNTYYFYNKGAKGVLVEANPQLIGELKYYRHRDIILNKAVSINDGENVDFYILNGDGLSTMDKKSAEEACRLNSVLRIEEVKTVETISINRIIEKYFEKAPTFISIDIEGQEIELINSIDFEKYRPLVIIVESIEYRPYLDINIKNNEVVNVMKEYGYVEYAFTGINSIFIDEKFMNERNEDR